MTHSKVNYILGINSAYHELSAVLLKNGELIAAVEEERFNRVKHGKEARVDNPSTLPVQSIEYCLSHAGIGWNDLTYIGLTFNPKARLKNIDVDRYYRKGDWGSKEGEELFYHRLLEIPTKLNDIAGTDIKEKIILVPHHICHASSAFFVSPFKEAAILSADGIGEITSTWMGYGQNGTIKALKEIPYPNSIGFMWEKLSKFLGFSEYDAAKVMGLAAFGNPDIYYPQFQKLVQLLPGGEYTIDNAILKSRLDDFRSIEKLFGIAKIVNPEERTRQHENLAASLQKITDDAILHCAEYLASKTGSKNLCLAGGLALNCVSNGKLWESGLFDQIYIQPAAHDAGTALGAAYYIWHNKLDGIRSFVMEHAYWGPSYSDQEVKQALNEAGVQYEKVENIERKTAHLIADGNIIGWFQGRLEWGPRALGNRSLIVDPRNNRMKSILNERVKKREPFRPFAPSVLEEDAGEWFNMPPACRSLSTRFMEITFDANKLKRTSIPAVVHVDGTSRIQIVDQKTNPRYHQLISEFKKITGVPMILNTSFNENEPIVCSPEDAIRTFKRTKMDYLVIHNYLVKK